MKHTLTVLLALTLCLTLLSGCFKSSPLKFDFSFEVEKETFTRGETVQITATVTNVSGRTYRYTGCSGNDFIPRISLYCGTEDQRYEIPCDPIVLPEDVIEKKVKSGESGSIVYSFTVPADARLGKYSLTLSYGEDQKVFNDILSILEMTTQNKSEGYRYTESYVSSGGDATHPITGMLGISNCKNGKAVRELCGGGLDRILSHPDEHFNKLPTLVYNDKIGISTPDNTEVGGFYVHILGGEKEQ